MPEIAAPKAKPHRKKKRDPAENVDDIENRERLEKLKEQLVQSNQGQGVLINAVREAVGHLCRRNGIVELEASIGISSGRISKGWQPELPTFETQLLLTALERGATRWDEVGDWKLFCDTYVVLDKSLTTSAQHRMVRMRSVQGEATSSITKTLLTRTDFAAAGGSNIRVRFQAKAERNLATTSAQVLLLLPESVRLSLRKTYVLRSRTEPTCTYRYTVYRAWTARTSSEAERLMHDETNGQSTAQCGIEVEVEVDENAAPEILMYASFGVLTKIQDLVAILTGGNRSLRKLSFTALCDDGKATKLRGQRQRKCAKN